MRPLKRNGSKSTHSIPLPSSILYCTEIYISNKKMGFMCTIFLRTRIILAKKPQTFTMANCISIPHVITNRVIVIPIPTYSIQFFSIIII